MHGYRPVVASDRPELFGMWHISFCFYEVFGAIGIIPNILLLFVLLAHRSYRKDYKLPILLCIADATNCLAILTLGVHSVTIYTTAIRDKIVPEETSLSCALSAPVYLRNIGNVMSPLVHGAIAFDRFICVKYPLWYRSNIATRQLLLPLVVVVAVLLFLPIGFYLAFLRRNSGPVKFFCGRRASFGNFYTMIIYVVLVFGYFLAFLSNVFSFILVRTGRSRNASLARSLKIAVIVSFVSFLLISVPNASSFLDIINPISPLTLQISTYLSVIAYSINLFLYIALSPEFRHRTLHSITCGYRKAFPESQAHIEVLEKKTTTIRS
ncbi:hypothetical protein RB195_017235 [Necator americanus]